MLIKTRGIVFKYFKYRETSIIVKVFTEKMGIQSYIVNGVRSKKARFKIALFQPLTILDLVAYSKPNNDIHRLSEIKCPEPLTSIPYDFYKSAMGIFIGEILYKSVKEESPAPEIFHFLANSIHVLDHLDHGFENFHLQFLLKLTKYLGFGIDQSVQFAPLTDTLLQQYKQLLSNNYDDHIVIDNATRRTLLDHIIDFYKINIDSLTEVRSLSVLKELMK